MGVNCSQSVPVYVTQRCGSLWIVVGSLWIVVGHCGSLWVVPGFSNHVFCGVVSGRSGDALCGT